MKLNISIMSYRDYDHFEMHCEGTDLEEVRRMTAFLHTLVTRRLRHSVPVDSGEDKWTEVGSYIDRTAPEVKERQDFDQGETLYSGHFRTTTALDQE